MIKPKVKLLSDDGFQQKFELQHPDGDYNFTIVHGYRSRNPNNGVGAKIDLNDEAAIRELWKQHLDRRATGIERE